MEADFLIALAELNVVNEFLCFGVSTSSSLLSLEVSLGFTFDRSEVAEADVETPLFLFLLDDFRF